GAIMNVVPEVIVALYVSPGRARQQKAKMSRVPDAPLALQSAQGQFVMAEVAVAGRVESPVEIAPAKPTRGGVLGAGGPPVHSFAFDIRPINRVGEADRSGNAVMVAIVVATMKYSPQH